MNNKKVIRTLALLATSAMATSVTVAQTQASESPVRQQKLVRTRTPVTPPTTTRINELQQQVEEQNRRIELLDRSIADQNERYRTLEKSVVEQQRATPPAATAATTDPVIQQGSTVVAPPLPLEQPRTVQVGQAPSSSAATRSLTVAPLFEQPGILTPRGSVVLEPSLQYAYSSSNQVALVGYTIIPALLIGLVDVRQVKQNTLTAALTGRFGITNRFELEARVPYVYRSNPTVSREIFAGSATDKVFDTSGRSLGDAEITARYQLNEGSATTPYMVGSLRFKSRTGKDPFEVVTDCVTRCIGNTTGTGQPLDLPTGSGFYTLQPGLTWLFPSDPVVFFGSFSYAYNFRRNDVSRQVLNGQTELLGNISAGNILGVNFGMGLSLNDKSAFSIGVDLNSVGRTKQNGVTVPGSVRTQLGTLMLGYSYRYSPKTTISLSVGAGLTRDTPDLMLTLRIPMSF